MAIPDDPATTNSTIETNPNSPNRAPFPQMLRACLAAASQTQNQAIAQAHAILDALEAANPTLGEASLASLATLLTRWHSDYASLQTAITDSALLLLDEVQTRHDMDSEQALHAFLTDTLAHPSASNEIGMKLLDTAELISQYDWQKRQAWNQLNRMRATVTDLFAQAANLTHTPDAKPDPTWDDPAHFNETTLAAIREKLDQLEQHQHRLGTQVQQLYQASIQRITDLARQAADAGCEPETLVSGKLALRDLQSVLLSEADPAKLTRIEQDLIHAISQRQQTKLVKTTPGAHTLRTEWDADKFTAMLDDLAESKRDLEVLLVLLGIHALQHSTTTLRLDTPSIDSLLRGVKQLAGGANLFELLNLLAPNLITGWHAAQTSAQVQLCLAFLAAQYTTSQKLPPDCLWNLGEEFPIPNAPGWSMMWQAALLGEPLPTIASGTRASAERLTQARIHAEQELQREGGIFVRLHSMSSRRHIGLMTNVLLPPVAAKLDALKHAEETLNKTVAVNLPRQVEQLKRTVSDYVRMHTEQALIDAYEAGVTATGIEDPDPFHRRKSLHILQTCADAVVHYGQALLELWILRLAQDPDLTQDKLIADLAAYPEAQQLGRRVIEQLIATANKTIPERNEATTHAHVIQIITTKLLNDPTYALRLPRYVARLTAERLAFADLHATLLDDLGEPVSFAGSADILIEQQAPNQALLLTQQISLAAQKRAQILRDSKEREITELETELLKLGGDAADLIVDRELGRWRLVQQELANRLAAQKNARETEDQRVRRRIIEMRGQIQKLDDALFEAQNTLPKDAYKLTQEGLNQARQAVTTPALLSEVETYLKEITYRLEHNSWPLAEMQNSVDQLERLLNGELRSQESKRQVTQVLGLLEQNELRQLGLNPNEVTASEVATRCDLLTAWLLVRDLPEVESEKLGAARVRTLHTLFQYFAQMVSMKHVRSPQGKPVSEDTPIAHSLWELEFPKTATLDKACAFIALPGKPPSAQHIKQIEKFIDDKDWLVDYFVFVFIPGCTPQIYKRLESSHRHKGLVIIDEATIIAMTLAEAEPKRHPLGLLRSLMMNSVHAETAEVFKINQAVETRTAIFVGRDTLIDRIASGSDSFALFGGRRIGKSSILKALRTRLERRGANVVVYSFEGKECTDDATACGLAKEMKLGEPVTNIAEFAQCLQTQLETQPAQSIVFLMDEIDRYIDENHERHLLIETLRNLADRSSGRLRVVVFGFMNLFACLQGRSCYSPASDPWRRMFTEINLGNLTPANAETIVHEGFYDVLGWKFDNRAIPQWIVERTGGHPAFVQCFCLKLQHRAGQRDDRIIRFDDIQAVFNDEDPDESFIAYVRKTLGMNLDPLGQYLILWLAKAEKQTRGFTRDQMREYTQLCKANIPDTMFQASLERLSVTSVVKETAPDAFDFSVPDYPMILDKLDQSAHMDRLEEEIQAEVKKLYGTQH